MWMKSIRMKCIRIKIIQMESRQIESIKKMKKSVEMSF